MNRYTFLYILCILGTVCLATPFKAERSSQDNLITRKLRTKRQSCQDGVYQHEGMKCCLCAAGQHRESHCSVSPDDGRCTYCEADRTYNSEPNSLGSCQPCTSCNPKVNLEVEDRCTIFRDSVCRCQQDHYCDKGKKDCRACYPCTKCGDEGIKVACSATNNTICHAIKGQGKGILPGVLVLATVILVASSVTIYLWKKNRYCFGPNGVLPNRSTNVEEEMQPLRDVDLWPHLPDIAKTLGWKDMKQVAVHRGMTHTTIESHQLNFPNDTQEQCSSLLRAWVEKEGMTTASKTLVQTLQHMKKKAKAEEIVAIISNKENVVTGKNSGAE